jgi:hypothetical protein
MQREPIQSEESLAIEANPNLTQHEETAPIESSPNPASIRAEIETRLSILEGYIQRLSKDEDDAERAILALANGLKGDVDDLRTLIAFAEGAPSKSAMAGIYTPSLTNVSNLDASTAIDLIYAQIDKIVTVTGFAYVDPTLPGTTQLGIGLPVISALADTTDVQGVCTSGLGESGIVFGDVANARATLSFTATNTTNHLIGFVFSYKIL